MVLIGAASPQPVAAATLGMGETLQAEATPPVPPPPIVAPVEAPVAEPAAETVVESIIEPAPAGPAWAPIVTTAAALAATGAIALVWLTAGPADERAVPPAPVADTSPLEPNPAPAPVETFTATQPAPVEPSPAPEEPAAPAPEAAMVSRLPAETLTTPTETPAEVVSAAGPESESIDDDLPPAVIDPLAFDPSEAVLVLRRGPDAESPAVAEAPSPDAAEPVPEPPTLDQRLAAAARQAGVWVERGPSDADSGPPTASAAAALTYVVPAIDLHNVPLDRALALLSDVAGVPITLPPSALRRAGVAADRPVDVVATEAPLAEVLADTLRQARLAYVADGPHVVVTRPGTDSQRTVTHDLADLVDGDPAALASELGRRLSFAEPLEVSATGGLELTAPMGVHYDLLVASERLRVERGLPTSTKYPRRLLEDSPDDGPLAKTLGRRTTFSFVEPTPLTEVFDHWRRVTGAPVLVDWAALAEAGYGPRTTVECSVTNRPWPAALDGVLGGLGLTWEPSFGGAIWIGVP